MKSLFKFITKSGLIFLIFSHLNAAIINGIKIEGNKRVSDETIRVYGEIKLNENVDENKINEILKNLYSTGFFEDIKVNEVNGIYGKYIIKGDEPARETIAVKTLPMNVNVEISMIAML